MTEITLGERVWWLHLPDRKRAGVVEELGPMIGVRADDDNENALIYVAPDELNHDTGSPIPTQDGIYSRIPDTVYHQDRDSLSSSGARTLTQYTPEEYMAQLLEPPNPKPQYDFGHAAHKMVLGEGAQLVRIDARDWRTNAAKAAREKAWAHGKAPLLAAQIEVAQRMAGKMFAHPVAAKLLQDGAAELSGYWHDDQTGVRLRCRPDWLPETGTGRPIIVEYKTAHSANPRRFARSAFDYGYHQQAAWNIDGITQVTGIENPAFLFIVQMKDPPWLVSVVQLEGEDIELGRAQNRAAIDLYAACRQTNTWPGYDGIHTIGLPGWARSQIRTDFEGTPAYE